VTIPGEAVRAGQVNFETFARSQHGQLVASLTLYCGDRWVAEELAQDALVRARERWEKVSVMDSPGGWLHRVAINLANSRFRRRRAEQRAHQRLSQPADRVDGSAATSADAVAVRRALASLPESQRSALVLRYFLDLSVAETADVLGMTPGSVKSATHRGLAALRRTFDVELGQSEEVHDGS
jgi:RNA polymerase sigma-70 factor (sigma-E family)